MLPLRVTCVREMDRGSSKYNMDSLGGNTSLLLFTGEGQSVGVLLKGQREVHVHIPSSTRCDGLSLSPFGHIYAFGERPKSPTMTPRSLPSDFEALKMPPKNAIHVSARNASLNRIAHANLSQRSLTGGKEKKRTTPTPATRATIKKPPPSPAHRRASRPRGACSAPRACSPP